MKMHLGKVFHLLGWICLSQSVVINQTEPEDNAHSDVSNEAVMRQLLELADTLKDVKNTTEKLNSDVEQIKTELKQVVASKTSIEEVKEKLEYIKVSLPDELDNLNAKVNAMIFSHAAVASKEDLRDLSSDMDARLNAFMGARASVASKADVENLTQRMTEEFEILRQNMSEVNEQHDAVRSTTDDNLASQLEQLISNVVTKEDLLRLNETCRGSGDHNVQVPTEVPDDAPPIVVGSRVRVKPSVANPKWGWGSVSHSSVGTIKSITGPKGVVDFPEQHYWTALLAEMEIVPV